MIIAEVVETADEVHASHQGFGTARQSLCPPHEVPLIQPALQMIPFLQGLGDGLDRGLVFAVVAEEDVVFEGHIGFSPRWAGIHRRSDHIRQAYRKNPLPASTDAFQHRTFSK
jgi:hypothetical protein